MSEDFTSDELDAIKSEIDALSTPVARCKYCNIPVCAISPTKEAICLECWPRKLEYDKMTKE